MTKRGSVTPRGGGDPGMADLEGELAMVARALEAVTRRRTYRLERAHYLLIRLVMEGGPQSVGQAARRLFLDGSTVTRQVAAMERLGLARKTSDPADARSAVVHVTPLGVRRAEAMRAERLRRLDRLFAGWAPAERRTAARILRRLNESLAAVLDGKGK